jgi:dolichol-phosphate mannosyltransferase
MRTDANSSALDLTPISHGTFVVNSVASGEAVAFSLVLPTRNEHDNIGEMVNALSPMLSAATNGSYEIIIVDDDSTDGTWQLAMELATADPHVRVIRRKGERGLATAVVRGWQASRGQVLGVMDSDLQHPPALIITLLAELRQDVDLVVGSRCANGGSNGDWNLPRKLISLASRWLGRVLLPEVLNRVTDPMAGCFVLRREVLTDVPLAPRGYKILLEVLARSRACNVREVGYVFRSRQNGHSKATLETFLEYMSHIWTLRTELRAPDETAPADLPATVASRRGWVAD